MKDKIKIKICGLKSVDDVLMINKFDVDYVGFVFAKSKRKITVEEAVKMKQLLRNDIKSVGVFADMDIKNIINISDKTGIDIIQLHSDETDEMCKIIKKPVWKSIPIRDKESVYLIDKYKNADGFVLDTFNKNLRGGSGTAFNWEFVKGLSQKFFVVLAGGINENNITEAYNVVKPNVIDLSSSVEIDGKKDYKKVKSLMRRIR